MMSLANGALPCSPGGCGGAWQPHRHRGTGYRCVALAALLAVLGPVPAYAGEAGIDVPMRRDVRAAVREPEQGEPNGVQSATEMVLREIAVLRTELGIGDFPARAEVQGDRRPVHVYVKSLEAMSKVVAVQRRLGVAESQVPGMPVDEVTSGDVIASVEGIIEGIRRIKTQMVIEQQAEVPAAAGPQTLSAAYKNLADASALLDGLVGRVLTPADVYRNAGAVLEDMNLVAAKLQVTLDVDPPEVDGVKESLDVAQQALRAAYKVVLLQSRLGMDASAVPTLTMVRVTPTEAYDLVGVLRAEMARIKWHLGINIPVVESSVAAQGRGAADVFAQMLLVVRNLEQLTAGTAT